MSPRRVAATCRLVCTDLYSFPVSGTFVTGKKQFSDRQNSWNFLGDTFKTVRIVNYTNLKTKISLRFKKIRVIYTSGKSFIFFTMNRRFIFSTIWSPITHTILKKEKENVEEERENYEQLDNTNNTNKKTPFNSIPIEIKTSHILPFIKRFHIENIIPWFYLRAYLSISVLFVIVHHK